MVSLSHAHYSASAAKGSFYCNIAILTSTGASKAMLYQGLFYQTAVKKRYAPYGAKAHSTKE